MDAEQFDHFVHGLARASTRRIALAGLLSALTGALMVSSSEETMAKRKKRRRKKKGQNVSPPPPPPPPPPPSGCAAGTKPCGPACIPLSECCGGCDPGESCCNGACFDLATDGQNCGVCGNVCETNLCERGACNCQNVNANCPQGCFCAKRINNDTFCTEGGTATDCGSDEDCGLGSVCLQGTEQCSFPCFP